MDARMMYLHAISPVHTGTGQAVDVIDLPVAREKTTNWPVVAGSSIKGVLRGLCKPADGEDNTLFTQAFGPETDKAKEGAGSLLFGDGRLLCLPVRSIYGAFAWLSCPLALDRYRRDHEASGLAVPPSLNADVPAEGIVVSEGAAIAPGDTVYLEDLDLQAARNAGMGALATHIASAVFDDAAWHGHFIARFGVVSDTVFTFLAETATEISARIQLKEDTKTVKDGALWYEEAIPAETIFSAPLLAAPRNGRTSAAMFDLVTAHLDGLVQIGGHASVGRGLMRLRLIEAQRERPTEAQP